MATTVGQYQRLINFADILTVGGQSFQALNNSKMPLGGGLFNPVIPYSMVQYTGPVYRTCVINGQNDSFQGDGTKILRSEMYGPGFAFGPSRTFQFDFYIGPQSPSHITTLDWFIFFQLHASNDVSPASPPLSLDIQPDGAGGEVIRFDLNYNSGGGNVNTDLGTVPLTRNAWHTIAITYADGHGTNTGIVIIEYDGTTVVNSTGIVTGYLAATGDSYPKFGIYAGNVSSAIPAGTNLTVYHRNFIFG